MKKRICLLVLIPAIALSAFAQTKDLVVLLDTSVGMSTSHRENIDYLTGAFLQEFLRLGDTFHLISFAENPRLEISRRIEGSGDVETIIARLLLMQPLGGEANLAAALAFAERSIAALPGNRPSKLIVVSAAAASAAQGIVDASSNRLRGQGTDLQFIQMPRAGISAPSRVPQAQPQAQNQSAQVAVQPSQTVPPQTAPGTQEAPARSTVGQAAPVQPPVTQGTPSSPAQVGLASPSQVPGTQGAPANPAQVGQTAPAQIPGMQGTPTSPAVGQQTAPGQQPAMQSDQVSQPVQGQLLQQEVPVTQGTAPTRSAQDGNAPSLTSGTGAPDQWAPSPAVQGQTASPRGRLPLPILILLAVLTLLALAFVITLVARNLHRVPNRAMARAAGMQRGSASLGSYSAGKGGLHTSLEHPPVARKPLPKDKEYPPLSGDDAPVMLNLFVEDQNTAIGRRNVHAVKAGQTLSLGGGNSDFLIFLIPIPPHIADVHFDGRTCTFVPRQPEFFPDLGSKSVPNCVGKNIRIISDRNYELHIRIERYEDPLVTLNRLLNSIFVPGEVT